MNVDLSDLKNLTNEETDQIKSAYWKIKRNEIADDPGKTGFWLITGLLLFAIFMFDPTFIRFLVLFIIGIACAGLAGYGITVGYLKALSKLKTK